MSTRLHALGFPAGWTLEFAQFLINVAETRTRSVEAPGGTYRVWRSREGAELWFHYPQAPRERATPPATLPPGIRASLRKLAGNPTTSEPAPLVVPSITPFHRGLSNCTIRIGRFLDVERSNPLEGSCLAWLPPATANGREQVIVLELAPYGLHRLRKPSYQTVAQIVCCAHAVWAFADKAAYAAATPTNRRIRPGAFSPVTEADVPDVRLIYGNSPITLGLATGVVRRSIRHVNPLTGAPYYWLQLETQRGTFDVVANAESIEGDVSEGHIAQACGSFLARLDGARV